MGVEYRTIELQTPGELPIAQGRFPHPKIGLSQFVVGLRGLGSDLQDVSEGQDRLAVPLLSEERVSALRVSQKPALRAPRRGECKDGQGQGGQQPQSDNKALRDPTWSHPHALPATLETRTFLLRPLYQILDGATKSYDVPSAPGLLHLEGFPVSNDQNSRDPRS